MDSVDEILTVQCEDLKIFQCCGAPCGGTISTLTILILLMGNLGIINSRIKYIYLQLYFIKNTHVSARAGLSLQIYNKKDRIQLKLISSTKIKKKRHVYLNDIYIFSNILPNTNIITSSI